MDPPHPVDAVAVWTAITAIATVMTAAVAAVYTYFTARLLRAQSLPKVIVYVRHDPDRPSVLCIRIENIGHDIARDIRFEASKPIPEKAFGITADSAVGGAVMSDGPLIEGIPALGPGDYRDITWGQYGGLTKALGGDTLELTYRYRSGRRRITGSTILDVHSYIGTDASERPPVIVARKLEAIAKALSGIDRSLSRLSEVRPHHHNDTGE